VSDAPTGVDRLGCTIYAKAIAATAREAESPFASLCVGIYARWGGGKSFLWTLVQRTLLALALVETLEKLFVQATLSTDARAREKAVGAFEKAVGRLRNPEAKESAMVDEEDKQRFEKQLDEMQAATKEKPGSACCRGGVGTLGQVMRSLVQFLVAFTTWCCAPKTCRLASKHEQGPTRGSRYVALSVHEHEPDSVMGQLEKELKQSREAKAVEWHATVVALLLLVLLPPLLLLLPLVSFAAAVSCRRKAAVAESSNSPPKVATQSEERADRVVKLLIGERTIGLGEVAQNQVSMVTTLRYAVLQIAQSFAYYCETALSLCAGLADGLTCTADDDDTLPKGATKYLVVEFNAWVYSGVRQPTTTTPPNTHLLPCLRAAVGPVVGIARQGALR
jgi:hypothetical protein